MNKVNIKNERFGMPVAIEETDQRNFSNVVWKCKCDCGKIVYKSTSYLSTDRCCRRRFVPVGTKENGGRKNHK